MLFGLVGEERMLQLPPLLYQPDAFFDIVHIVPRSNITPLLLGVVSSIVTVFPASPPHIPDIRVGRSYAKYLFEVPSIVIPLDQSESVFVGGTKKLLVPGICIFVYMELSRFV